VASACCWCPELGAAELGTGQGGPLSSCASQQTPRSGLKALARISQTGQFSPWSYAAVDKGVSRSGDWVQASTAKKPFWQFVSCALPVAVDQAREMRYCAGRAQCSLPSSEWNLGTWCTVSRERLSGGAEAEGSRLEPREHPVLFSQHSNPRESNRLSPGRCVTGYISAKERDYREGQLQ